MLIYPVAEVAWTRMRARIAGTADEYFLNVDWGNDNAVEKIVIDIMIIIIAVLLVT